MFITFFLTRTCRLLSATFTIIKFFKLYNSPFSFSWTSLLSRLFSRLFSLKVLSFTPSWIPLTPLIFFLNNAIDLILSVSPLSKTFFSFFWRAIILIMILKKRLMWTNMSHRKSLYTLSQFRMLFDKCITSSFFQKW